MEDCPVVDISKVGCEKAIHLALIEWGGFLVIGHGVDIELRSKMFEYASKFFNLPQKVKDSVHLKHGGAAWRGYMPYGGERSQSGTITDSKEGYVCFTIYVVFRVCHDANTMINKNISGCTWGRNIPNLTAMSLPNFQHGEGISSQTMSFQDFVN